MLIARIPLASLGVTSTVRGHASFLFQLDIKSFRRTITTVGPGEQNKIGGGKMNCGRDSISEGTRFHLVDRLS